MFNFNAIIKFSREVEPQTLVIAQSYPFNAFFKLPKQLLDIQYGTGMANNAGVKKIIEFMSN